MQTYYLLETFTMETVILRLVLSAICGALIGLNRSSKGREAGFKTHAIVCMASCLVMLTGLYIYEMYGAIDDVTRMAAQVISGVGFLGVGTIIVTGRNEVKGLTTAAGLWACAGIGIACGIGFYFGACFTTALVLFFYYVMTKVDHQARAYSKDLDCYMVFTNEESMWKQLEFLKQDGFQVVNLQLQDSNTSSTVVTWTLMSKRKFNHADMLEYLNGLEGVRYAGRT